MSITITVQDETTGGERQDACTLEFPTERITVRELIRSRVYQEVKDHNVKRNQGVFRGLVQPSDAERELNGFRLKTPREVDWRKQFEVALESFERNGFLILVDDRQVESLDEEVELSKDTSIAFLRLVPLVGG